VDIKLKRHFLALEASKPQRKPSNKSSRTNAKRRKDYSMDTTSNESTNSLRKGKVRFFRDDRGYGFIAPSDGSADCFLHISALERANIRSHQLEKDTEVMFNTKPDRKDSRRSMVDHLELVV
jgi:cold shock protein